MLTQLIPNTAHLIFHRPLFTALLALAGLIVILAPSPMRFSPPRLRSFQIDAGQFSYSPYHINVNPGDVVTIQFVSTDVVHGLYIDGYDVSVEADPGQTAALTFVADRSGSFRFRCNVTCGSMHPFMIGKLTVGMNDWLFRSFGLTLLAFLGIIGLKTRKV